MRSLCEAFATDAFVLRETFPERASGIRDLFEAKRRIDRSDAGTPAAEAVSSMGLTVQEFIESHVRDDRITGIFAILWGYLGLVPSKLSAFMYAMMRSGYHFGGCHYVKGGGQALSDAFVSVIEETGGKVLLNTEVSKIVTEGGHFVGVEAAKRGAFRASVVVSNAAAPVTFPRRGLQIRLSANRGGSPGGNPLSQSAPYILHAADVSYFSGKVRPAFAHKSLWVREVLPDIPEIKRRTGVHFFPAVETPDGEMWQDTSDILDRLEAAHPTPALYPATPLQRVVAFLVELYGDEMGVLPAMHYRWSFEESVAKVRVDFSTPTGEEGAGDVFARRMKGALPLLGITPETAPAIEAHTRELLDRLSAHFRAHRYLLGDSMSLADCGLMGPFYGHLFRDAVPERLLYQSAFPVCAWIERTNRPPRDQGGWLEGDALAPTLLPVLETMADAVPILVASVEATQEWAETQARAGEIVPQATGFLPASYRDVTLSSAARGYTVWMVQRALDAYLALGGEDRSRVDAALAGSGWEPLFALRPRHRVVKKNYQVVWA